MASAIDPSQIPGKDIDPDAIETNAATIGTAAGQVRENGSNVHLKWQGMAGVYSAPESGTLLGLMQPVSSQATEAGDNLEIVAAALKSFAAEVRPIKAELESLRTQAQAFVDTVVANGVSVRELNPAWMSTQGYYGGGYATYSPYGATTSSSDVSQYRYVTKQWHEHQPSVDRNNELIAAVNAQQVALWDAERTCANKIRALYGAAPLHAFQSEDDVNGYGLSEIPEGTEMPWGAEVERTEGCGEATARFVFQDFLWEGIIVGGIWGTIQGLGTLTLGYNPATGEWFSGEAYGAAWGNLGLLAASGLMNSPVLAPLMWADQGMESFGGGGFLPDEVRDFKATADEAALNTGKALIAWDQWQDDPGTALGETVFNVGTILIPGGAAVAGVKTAGTAASVLSRMARVVDLIDPGAWAFNGATRLGGLGLSGIDNLIGRLGLGKIDPPHIEIYTAMDTPSAFRALDEWGVDMSQVTARVDAGVPMLEFPGGRVELPAGAFDGALANETVGGVPIREAADEAPVRVPVREPELVAAGGVRAETGPGAVNTIVDDAPVRTETTTTGGSAGESTIVRESGSGGGSDTGSAAGDGRAANDGSMQDADPRGSDGTDSDGTGSGGDAGSGSGGADGGSGSGGDGGSAGGAADDPSDSIAWQSTEDPSLVLTHAEKAAVDDFLAGSRASEPAITDALQRVEAQHPDARLTGLEYRLKGDDSMYRKVADDLRDYAPGQAAVEDVVGSMKDSIRYTYVVPDATYTPTVSGILRDLQAEGLVPYGPLKNTWGSDGYVGINSTWFDPVSNRVIEVQMHTDASFDAKMAVHESYETARLPGVDPELKTQLEAEMAETFAAVPRPDGAAGIGWPEPVPGSGFFDVGFDVTPEPFPPSPGAAAVDTSLVDDAIMARFDPHTGTDRAVFWSGRVDLGNDFGSAMDGAGVYAASQRATTLEQLLESQGLLDDMPDDWSRPETMETWRAVSSSIAENARGSVVAYVGDVRAGSVWNMYELPRLIANPDVTRITVIDAHTGRPLHVYER